MLGYFSLVGLLRLHSLLGDFYQAVKVLENMELNKKVKLFYKQSHCAFNTISCCFFLNFRLCILVYQHAKSRPTIMLGLLT